MFQQTHDGSGEGGYARVYFHNLTAHDVCIADADGNIIRTLKSEGLARVGTTEEFAGALGGIPLITRSWTAVEGLPEPIIDDVDFHYYVVSSLVLAQVLERSDVLAPDTGNTAVRDENGRVAAVRRFVRN